MRGSTVQFRDAAAGNCVTDYIVTGTRHIHLTDLDIVSSLLRWWCHIILLYCFTDRARHTHNSQDARLILPYKIDPIIVPLIITTEHEQSSWSPVPTYFKQTYDMIYNDMSWHDMTYSLVSRGLWWGWGQGLGHIQWAHILKKTGIDA